ncbi:MAG: ribonuclease D [Candidatus Puniceispirillum sp.]|nr:ribonuclease D [Candidatus Pelagibacter sp.]MBA4283182.1 ribonuclease D [Candidatus Puniceispirillum sp.]
MRCAFYCRAKEYNIDELSKFLRDAGLEPKFYDHVIHFRKETESGLRESSEEFIQDRDIFIFPYGCVCFWGMNEEEEQSILHYIRLHEIDSVENPTFDACVYDYSDESCINEEEDTIFLESQDPLIKLSFSHGLTQSVKLEVFEERSNETIKRTRHIPEEVAKNGKISLSRRKLSQKIGALFSERNSINLDCDILDTPEFFWRRPRFETLYRLSYEYMDIAQRLDILNRRLEVIHELYEILSNELKHAHSSRLEWIIILLIVSEVIMSIFQYDIVVSFFKRIGFS